MFIAGSTEEKGEVKIIDGVGIWELATGRVGQAFPITILLLGRSNDKILKNDVSRASSHNTHYQCLTYCRDEWKYLLQNALIPSTKVGVQLLTYSETQGTKRTGKLHKFS